MSRGFINLLGPLFTRAFKPGASEVKAARLTTVSSSVTRATVFTPTSGKKVRIVSVQLANASTTGTIFWVYFDTGAAITTNPGKEIANAYLDLDTVPSWALSWPDGAGPVGDVDDVVSLRTNVDIATTGMIIVHYREE